LNGWTLISQMTQMNADKKTEARLFDKVVQSSALSALIREISDHL
jgi:hypothetical protein